MPHPVLNNWRILRTSDNFAAPEIAAHRIAGQVTGHPNFCDGDDIETSQVDYVDPVNGEVKTASRVYKLGRPHHDQPLIKVAMAHIEHSTRALSDLATSWEETCAFRQDAHERRQRARDAARA